MAYTRWNESGHYIFGGTDYVDFSGTIIPDDEVDVFIHKLYGYQSDGDDEFWERVHHGGRVIDNFKKGIRIKKLYKYSGDLETQTAAIAALADEIWHEHFTPIIGTAQVDYMLAKFQSAEQIYNDIKNNDYYYFTAKDTDNDKLIGYCAVQPQKDFLLLSKLYIHHDFRGKGIARSFIDEVIALCKYEYDFYKIGKIHLTVNKHNDGAIAVYQKIGFKTVDSVETDIGGGFVMDDFVMELTI